ncbi:MAG: tetratricopeptide repeat protein [bacterium]|nr:tetratricopeptide repeat protein [bacterium]
MNRDRYDLPLTTSSDRAAAHYREGVDYMLSAWHGAEDAFDKAIAADPGFALAHIGRARLHQLNMEGGKARAMAAQARELVAGATPREKSQVEIIAAVIEGKPKVAIPAGEAHLDDHPRDAQVLSMLLGAFGLYAFSGRPDHDAAKLAICEKHAGHYGEDWWFTSYLGWSHTEAGNLGTGRKLSERAVELRAANANAAHGLSHVMFEQGDMEAGRVFLSQWMPAHDRQSFLHGHLAWHTALTLLDADDPAGALGIYEQHIKPADRPYPPLNIFTDGASLLWRLSLAGQTGLEEHLRDIAAYGEKHFPQAGAHFADVHFALAAADGDAFDARLSQLEARAADGKLLPGRAAIDLCRGVLAFATGDNDGAIRLLEPAMAELARIGGSHAQRELWEDTLIVACLRAGQGDRASGRISARLDRRPSARDEAWARAARGDTA